MAARGRFGVKISILDAMMRAGLWKEEPMKKWLLVSPEEDSLVCLETGALIELAGDNTLRYRLPAERESMTLARYSDRKNSLAALRHLADELEAMRPPKA
jgi:hypothetical protein